MILIHCAFSLMLSHTQFLSHSLLHIPSHHPISMLLSLLACPACIGLANTLAYISFSAPDLPLYISAMVDLLPWKTSIGPMSCPCAIRNLLIFIPWLRESENATSSASGLAFVAMTRSRRIAGYPGPPDHHFRGPHFIGDRDHTRDRDGIPPSDAPERPLRRPCPHRHFGCGTSHN
jgi:hypothetical protein